MKSNPPYLLIAVIFFLVILYASFISSINTYLPYSSDTLFPNTYPYEGFESHSLEYASNPDQKAMDSYTSYLMNNASTTCRKVFGFDGLFCQPDIADNKLDIFSEAPGSLNCAGSGLSNSKGSLCLDKHMSKMLSSRGGNSTGHDSQIGH